MVRKGVDWREFLSWIINGTALKGAAEHDATRLDRVYTVHDIKCCLPGMGAKGAASFERPCAEVTFDVSDAPWECQSEASGCSTPKRRMKLAMSNPPGASVSCDASLGAGQLEPDWASAIWLWVKIKPPGERRF